MNEKRNPHYCKHCGVEFYALDSLQIHEATCLCNFCHYFDLYAPGFCRSDHCVKEKERKKEREKEKSRE